MPKPLKRRLALLATAAAIALAPGVAHADPITTAIVAVVNAVGGAAVAASIGNFLVAYGAGIYATAASWALGKLTAPKVSSASQERQAAVTQLTLGEVAREAIVGRAATGGSLADAYYYGGTNGTDWNAFVIAIADHPCDALEGFYVNDTYVPFTGDGEVTGYGGQLRVVWRPGEADDADLPSNVQGLGPATAAGSMKGVARVFVAYKADAPDSKNPIWTAGRPQFLWVVRGARLYDPREDDTVVGGEGAQRWDDPSTWTWSENAELARYGFNRGFYAFNQVDDQNRLRVGRGLSAYEAPPERVIAAANLCDELVEIDETTSEPRYRVGGVIRANESFDRVEQMFADAMGGYIIQPEGGVAVDPGQAKTPVASITDDEILAGFPISVTPFRSDSDRVNTVVARYIEPSQKYADTAAGVKRDPADIVRDGGPMEEVLSLPLVPYRTQAERLAEYRRRQHRLERLASITLGPRFAFIEEGDWIEWSSARWGDAPKLFRVTAYALDQGWRNTLSVEETAYEVFGFGGEYTPVEVQTPALPPGALALTGVSAMAIQLAGENDELTPAVRLSWTTPVDRAIDRIRAEVRLTGETDVASTTTDEVNEGVLVVTNGVPPSASIQVRLYPIGLPGRAVIPSSWISLSTAGLIATDTKAFGGLTADQIQGIEAAARKAQLDVMNARLKALADLNAAMAQIRAVLEGRPMGEVLVEQRDILVQTNVTVGENTAAITAETLARQTAVSAEAYARTLLATDYAGFKASAETSLATLSTTTSATAASLTTLSTDYSGFKSSTTSTLASQSTAISTTAASLTTLESTVGANKASADAGLLTLTNGVSTLSTQYTTLSSTVSSNKASADSSISTLTTSVSSVSSTVTALSSDYSGFKSSANASLTTLSSAQSTQATQITTLQSNATSLSATVTSQAATLADVSSKVAVARFVVEAAASGGLPARLALTSDSLGGSNIALSAAKIYFGDNTVFNDATDTLRTVTGSTAYVIAWGEAFGVDGDLLSWIGPASVPTGSATRSNAYFYTAKTTPYLGGSALPTGGGGAGFEVNLSTPLVTGSRSGVGSATTDNVSVSTTGGDGSVSYSWASLSGASFTISSTTGSLVSFTGSISSLGQTLDGYWRVTARDSAGHVAFADVHILISETS
ncbi:hypothetical protein J2X45_003407 [Caulobacter sp. BE264]|uniref:phage tail protein n=1 Tax=Caulobacter sp. BE264 TaxID=2817724 RepID=UPI00285681B2|nr:phage tail protein [Caulobacter sp. BE264]MDR7232301.1 hypothetical protein [Caulobacter sp. BE264]